MATVSSLDKDLRSMRLDKYTPVRANQNRQWIEETLGERLAGGDLLEALKDGIALCKLANLAVPGAVRFKESSMPFVQMENISHFLRACQAQPLGLQAHDCFLTVDLYESKDPAQVLQCIEAFSRRAAAVNPTRFPKTIGGRKIMSPQRTGGSSEGGFGRPRGMSGTSQTSNTAAGRISPVKTGGASSPTGASSWARKDDMGTTAPAWNISQYGWTGGASQGNQGITFGGRRQITSAAPHVPSIAEKERRRREREEEEAKLKAQAEEAERKRQAEREAEEERSRAEEERRWAEQTKMLKEKEKREAEAEKRRWEEEERRWRQEEEKRIQEEKEVELRLEKERQRKAANGDNRLQGQFLSQYKADQSRTTESDRIKELERQLAEAKEREARYQRERQDRFDPDSKSATSSSPAPAPLSIRRTAAARELSLEPELEEDSIQESERSFLQSEWPARNISPPAEPPRPLPVPAAAPKSPAQPPRAAAAAVSPPSLPPRGAPAAASTPPQPPRPLPNPAAYASQNSTPSRTDRFLSTNPAPAAAKPAAHTPAEAAFSTGAEVDAENQRRQAAQAKTKAGGWASKSLLEREMERERQRQQEWEEEQRATQSAVDEGRVDRGAGAGPGQSWDVHQYGYTGGDNLNKGGGGVYAGRRQLVGPRPLGSKGGS